MKRFGILIRREQKTVLAQNGQKFSNERLRRGNTIKI